MLRRNFMQVLAGVFGLGTAAVATPAVERNLRGSALAHTSVRRVESITPNYAAMRPAEFAHHVQKAMQALDDRMRQIEEQQAAANVRILDSLARMREPLRINIRDVRER